MFARWRQRRDESAQAAQRYVEIVGAARQQAFYREGGVADDIDGRFDMISLMLALYLKVLENAGRADFAQRVAEMFFADMDRSLREMGVGDLSVGKQVGKMASAFYGQRIAYDQALAGEPEALGGRIAATLYRNETFNPQHAAWMAKFVIAQRDALHMAALDQLILGPLPLLPPEAL